MTKPTQTRTFKVAPGAPGAGDRVVIPPKGLITGPGARHKRFKSGDTFELRADQVDRFIRNRIKLGDLVEVAAPAPARAAVTVKEG